MRIFRYSREGQAKEENWSLASNKAFSAAYNWERPFIEEKIKMSKDCLAREVCCGKCTKKAERKEISEN